MDLCWRLDKWDGKALDPSLMSVPLELTEHFILSPRMLTWARGGHTGPISGFFLDPPSLPCGLSPSQCKWISFPSRGYSVLNVSWNGLSFTACLSLLTPWSSSHKWGIKSSWRSSGIECAPCSSPTGYHLVGLHQGTSRVLVAPCSAEPCFPRGTVCSGVPDWEGSKVVGSGRGRDA